MKTHLCVSDRCLLCPCEKVGTVTSPGSGSEGKLHRLAGPLVLFVTADRLAGPGSWNTSEVKGLLLVKAGPLGWVESSGAGKGFGAATPAPCAAFTGGASSFGGSAPFLPDKEFTWNGSGRGPFRADVPFGLERGATDVVVSMVMAEGVPNCVGGLEWAGE